MTTRRSLFSLLAGMFCAKKVVKAEPSRFIECDMIPVPPVSLMPSPELEWERGLNKPIAILIGTGTPPPISRDDYRVKGPCSREQDAICALIGHKGEIIVHLFGEWEKVIPLKTLLNCWCNLSHNAVPPRLYVDGVSYAVCRRPILPAGYIYPLAE
jgi:hypothetical protein